MTDTEEREAIVAAIKPLLAEHDPVIQGAALAELLALFVAGHRPAVRDEILGMHVSAVRELVPIAEREILNYGPRPERWETPRG
jgi:hypothetical protein